MTSAERIQARIARDKARRALKNQIRAEKFGTLEKVMTMQHLVRSLQKRRKGTDWKGSVQTFVSHAVVKLKRLYDSFRSGGFEVAQNIRLVKIRERGKLRICRAVYIDTRVVQGVLCDDCITPMTQPHLIYDNPASTAGKGVRHMRDRIMRMLVREIKKHGPRKVCVLVTDFRQFFDNIRHSRCRKELEKSGIEDRLIDMIMMFVKMYHRQDYLKIIDPKERAGKLKSLDEEKDVGATLGSQISQDMALVVPNDVDHAAKDRFGMKSFGRFMDDGIAISDKQTIRDFIPVFRESAKKCGFSLHERKTQIKRGYRGFDFLKIKYRILDSGRIIRKEVRSGIVRMRRKLKRLHRKVRDRKIPIEYAFKAFASWYGMMRKIGNTYRQRIALLRQYNRLFDCYRMEVFAA